MNIIDTEQAFDDLVILTNLLRQKDYNAIDDIMRHTICEETQTMRMITILRTVANSQTKLKEYNNFLERSYQTVVVDREQEERIFQGLI